MCRKVSYVAKTVQMHFCFCEMNVKKNNMKPVPVVTGVLCKLTKIVLCYFNGERSYILELY